jgi:hypothetical protein
MKRAFQACSIDQSREASIKHAGPVALDQLEPLLSQIRRIPDLKERSRGVFYRKGKAHLHFHEDPVGLFADLRQGEDFVRFDVSDAKGRKTLLATAKPAG